MTLNCSVSSASPATTNVVMGYVGNNNIYLDLDSSPSEDKEIVNDFIEVIGNHLNVNILDYDGSDYFEANIIIPGETDTEEIFIEYFSFSEEEKIKVNQFVNLIYSLAE
jgi:hypothetical protein